MLIKTQFSLKGMRGALSGIALCWESWEGVRAGQAKTQPMKPHYPVPGAGPWSQVDLWAVSGVHHIGPTYSVSELTSTCVMLTLIVILADWAETLATYTSN